MADVDRFSLGIGRRHTRLWNANTRQIRGIVHLHPSATVLMYLKGVCRIIAVAIHKACNGEQGNQSSSNPSETTVLLPFSDHCLYRLSPAMTTTWQIAGDIRHSCGKPATCRRNYGVLVLACLEWKHTSTI